MKKQLGLFFLFAIVQGQQWCRAQGEPRPVPELKLRQLYVSAGIGRCVPGPGAQAFIAVAFILSNHWGGSLRYSVGSYDAPNTPADYEPGLVLFGSSRPQDQVSIFSFMACYQWKLDPYVRAGIEAGPADVISDKSEFVPSVATGWFSLGSNYTQEVHTKCTAGLSLRGYLQFPIGRSFGLEAGLFGNINAAQSTIAFECCLDFGHMRKRIRRE